jgi:hypothetical protein
VKLASGAAPADKGHLMSGEKELVTLSVTTGRALYVKK